MAFGEFKVNTAYKVRSEKLCGKGFQYFKTKFPLISDQKLKYETRRDEGPEFYKHLEWSRTKQVKTTRIIQKLLSSYKPLKYNTSLKIYFLHSHFSANLGDEYGEKFHQYITHREGATMGNGKKQCLPIFVGRFIAQLINNRKYETEQNYEVY